MKKDTRSEQPMSMSIKPLENSVPLKFHIETFGCQMNVNDTEIIRSILIENGHSYCDDVESADLILTNTCAIRENAEAKVWTRLGYFHTLKQKRKLIHQKGAARKAERYPLLGVLGCMAERLKDNLLEDESVDFICGPDAYRDIPRLVSTVRSTNQKDANTQLSLDETYADINPVRTTDSCSAFVSIMRGCNNMCSYCIVPFTRGRERSRETSSIIKEVKTLLDDGVKEVVLLGQNVNGFHDVSESSAQKYPIRPYSATPGFKNIFNSKSRDRAGARFVDLLDEVSSLDPELRVRFTSPHPKDFPEDVLTLIANRPNLCSSLHLPFQSGSSSVLERMRRGYTREAYIELVQNARKIIPGLSISADLITGFCGETEEEHQETISLLKLLKFDQAYTFAYSMRDKTHANRTMVDDVSEEIKSRRLSEIIETFHLHVHAKTSAEELGQYRLVLVEGMAKKSKEGNILLSGRTGHNKRVVFPMNHTLFKSWFDYAHFVQQEGFMKDLSLSEYFQDNCDPLLLKQLEKHGNLGLFNKICVDSESVLNRSTDFEGMQSSTDHSPLTITSQTFSRYLSHHSATFGDAIAAPLTPEELMGKFIVVRVLKVNSATLRGVAVAHSSITEFDRTGMIM